MCFFALVMCLFGKYGFCMGCVPSRFVVYGKGNGVFAKYEEIAVGFEKFFLHLHPLYHFIR